MKQKSKLCRQIKENILMIKKAALSHAIVLMEDIMVRIPFKMSDFKGE